MEKGDGSRFEQTQLLGRRIRTGEGQSARATARKITATDRGVRTQLVAAVLLPGGLVVAGIGWFVLAVADGVDAGRIDAEFRQGFACGQARRSPSERLYSSVPRSSQFPSTRRQLKV